MLREGMTFPKRIQYALPALSSWPSRRAKTGSKARLCRCERFPRRMPSLSVSSIQLCRTMLCRMETEVVKQIVNRLWTKGCLETDKRRHAHERSCPSSGQRRSFPSSSVLGQMLHYSWLTRWMCARCSNEENVFVDAWLKPDFIKLS